MVGENVKIGGKFAIAFALIIGAFVVTSGTTHVKLSVTQRVAAVNAQGNDIVNDVDDAVEAALRTRIDLSRVLEDPSDKRVDQIEVDRKDFEQAVAAARSRNIEYPKEADVTLLINKIVTAFDTWYLNESEAIPRLHHDASLRTPTTAPQSVEQSAPLDEALFAVSNEAKSKIARWSREDQTAEDDAIATVRRLQTAGPLTALAIAIVVCGWLSRSIARPIGAMTATMSALAAGDHAVTVPGAGRRDEIGRMADAVQTFKLVAIEKARLESEVSAEAAAAQSRAIRGLGEGLRKLAGGDLTNCLKDGFTGVYAQMRNDYNDAVLKLKETMLAVVSGTSAIRFGSNELSSATDDLSQRTEQQAVALEKTAAAIEEITEALRQTSDGALVARRAVDVVRTTAEKSDAIMSQTMQAMTAIEDSSGKIAEIVSVIDHIAAQTNLLALNAGIEAARAGSSGKGFAVVATEVRDLAQGSAKAAQDIKTLISASTSRVGEGAVLVEQTGKALRHILIQVTEVSTIVANIATSAKEQSVALSAINTAFGQIDQATQKNAAMAEESMIASRQLSSKTSELAQLIGRFRTGD